MNAVFDPHTSLQHIQRPTPPAVDNWESPRFWQFSTPQEDSVFEPCPCPAATNAGRWAAKRYTHQSTWSGDYETKAQAMAQIRHTHRNWSWISTLARVGAFIVLVGVALYALWLLIFGLPITSYREVPEGFQGAPYLRSTYSQPYPAAAVYLTVAGFAMIGLIRRDWLRLAWLSVALMVLWSVLWLFSTGAALLPVEGILIALMVIITRTWSKTGQ